MIMPVSHGAPVTHGKNKIPDGVIILVLQIGTDPKNLYHKIIGSSTAYS